MRMVGRPTLRRDDARMNRDLLLLKRLQVSLQEHHSGDLSQRAIRSIDSLIGDLVILRVLAA